jgi:quercetin dioxygenase-like cupin family protein
MPMRGGRFARAARRGGGEPHGRRNGVSMAAKVYLDGWVRVERLGRERVDGRFRGGDLRGEVAWLASGHAYEHLHVVEFAAAGVRRGFHRHVAHRETLYVFTGALRCLASRPGRARLERLLEAGDLVTMAPGLAHGFVAREPSIAVAMGTGSDPVEDCVAAPELAEGL